MFVTDYTMHLLDHVKKIHFIGCGGSGMYPLIQILAAKGYEISGSDVLDGSIIRYEREMGVKVSLGHSADNVIGTDMVVYSAAISKDNVEQNAAASYGIPTIERSGDHGSGGGFSVSAGDADALFVQAAHVTQQNAALDGGDAGKKIKF